MFGSKLDPLRYTPFQRWRRAGEQARRLKALRRALAEESHEDDRRVLRAWIEALETDRELLRTWKRQPLQQRPAEEEVRRAVRECLAAFKEAYAVLGAQARFRTRSQLRQDLRDEQRTEAMGQTLYEAAADPNADVDSLNRWMSHVAHQTRLAKAYNALGHLDELRWLRGAQTRTSLAAGLVGQIVAGQRGQPTPEAAERMRSDRRLLERLVAEERAANPATAERDWTSLAEELCGITSSYERGVFEKWANEQDTDAAFLTAATKGSALAQVLELSKRELAAVSEEIKRDLDYRLDALSQTGFEPSETPEAPSPDDDGPGPVDPPAAGAAGPREPSPPTPLGSGPGSGAAAEPAPNAQPAPPKPAGDPRGPDRGRASEARDEARLGSPPPGSAPPAEGPAAGTAPEPEASPAVAPEGSQASPPVRGEVPSVGPGRRGARELNGLPRPGHDGDEPNPAPPGTHGRGRPAEGSAHAPGQEPGPRPPTVIPPKPKERPGPSPQAKPGQRKRPQRPDLDV